MTKTQTYSNTRNIESETQVEQIMDLDVDVVELKTENPSPAKGNHSGNLSNPRKPYKTNFAMWKS